MNDEVYKGYYEMVWWRLWRKISSFPSWRVRKNFFNLFMKTVCPAENDLVLDMGITADLVHKADNYFEKLYPYPNKITAIGIENLSRLKAVYPLIKLAQADGTNLQFAHVSNRDLHLFDYSWLKTITGFCRKDFDINHLAMFSMFQIQRRITHITRLFSKDCAKQSLFCG